jgi:hypothetical protein
VSATTAISIGRCKSRVLSFNTRARPRLTGWLKAYKLKT